MSVIEGKQSHNMFSESVVPPRFFFKVLLVLAEATEICPLYPKTGLNPNIGCAYARVHVHMHVHMHACIRAYARVHTCICTRAHVHVHACTHAYRAYAR